MNYITQLRETVSELKEEISEIHDALQALNVYLNSEKFHEDPTVQVRDILNRIPIVYKR